MTPKDNAEEIIEKHYLQIKEYPAEIYSDDIEIQTAKKCAIITIDEIFDSIYHSESEEKLTDDLQYWCQVKSELLKL